MFTPAHVPTSPDELLKPFVPRLLITWLRETPDATHRDVDGSLAFVDISGFTTMTERLARKGKVGAEEVSDTLNATFTELLSVAYDYGAGLVKWGGDAVLLLFDGPEHAARACRASAGMQRTLRRVGRLRTTAGNVTLRMSVGIHSGTFSFFLVGDVHRELLIAGPAATATVAMEKIADAGEIAISPATAALLDPHHVGPAKGEALLLRGEPDAEAERVAPAPDATGLDLASCLPTAIRRHLLAEEGEPEHRPVAAAFVELTGTDELIESEGPAVTAAALHERVVAVQEATERYEVTFFETDISADGFKIMLIAGAPLSAGNDEERMVRAAHQIITTPGRLPLRIGVNCGRVFSGDFGPPYRRTYSVKGDAINTAARVMGKAEPGQVLVTAPVLERSRTRFHTVALEPFRLKGKAQPVQAFLLEGIAGAQTTGEHDGPLVGREAELGVLLDALRRAGEGNGAHVELVGDPGIGKSRLAAALREHADAFAVLHATCEEYDESTPYLPVRRLLRRQLGLRAGMSRDEQHERLRAAVERVDPGLLPWLPLIGAVLEVTVPSTPETSSLDESLRRARLEEATYAFVAGLFHSPTVIVFEDVHWMDEGSSDLVRRLRDDVERFPLLLLTTRRDQDARLVAGSQRSTSIRLQPLAAGEALALVEAETEDEPLPGHVVAALAERSGGNPLFLGELVLAVRRSGLETLPDSVEQLVAVQIDRLGPRDRSILRCAAVLGRSFPEELLRETVTDYRIDDDTWERLADFLRREEESGDVHFRHALVRDTAYEGLSFSRRRALHGRAGGTIERRQRHPADDAEMLSLHFFEAHDFARAWSYSRTAGDHARDVYANVEACEFYERAIQAARRLGDVAPAELASIWESLGDARWTIGDYAAASDAYRAARPHVAGDAVREAGLLLKTARSHERQGKYPQALRWATRGLRALDGVTGRAAGSIRAQLLVSQGSIRQTQGRSGDALAWCLRAVDEAKRAHDKRTLANAYFVIDWAHVGLGRPAEATRSAEALALYEEIGDLSGQAGVLMGMGAFAYWQGRWDDARELYDRGRLLRERLGNVVAAADGTFNVAEILVDQGRLEEAATLARDVLRVWRAGGSPHAEGVAHAKRLLGRIASRSSRVEEGLTLLAEARDDFRELGSQTEVAETEARLAAALVRAGLSDEGLELASDALRRASPIHVPLLQRVRGYALVQTGDTAAARDAFTESLASARAQWADYEAAITLDALVQLAELVGEEDDALRVERDAILGRLGVVHVPEFPVVSAR
jgi:class 3 adenylate cyclase/tetratricopeptide (TPR) repeat protein